MNGQKSFNGFYFDDNFIFDKQINSIARIEFHAIINYRQFFL